MVGSWLLISDVEDERRSPQRALPPAERQPHEAGLLEAANALAERIKRFPAYTSLSRVQQAAVWAIKAVWCSFDHRGTFDDPSKENSFYLRWQTHISKVLRYKLSLLWRDGAFFVDQRNPVKLASSSKQVFSNLTQRNVVFTLLYCKAVKRSIIYPFF